MQNLDSIDLSATQRRAVMKLAVELVKAEDSAEPAAEVEAEPVVEPQPVRRGKRNR